MSEKRLSFTSSGDFEVHVYGCCSEEELRELMPESGDLSGCTESEILNRRYIYLKFINRADQDGAYGVYFHLIETTPWPEDAEKFTRFKLVWENKTGLDREKSI